MKFNQLSAFEKHLEHIHPSHLSDVYLIIDSEPYVQKKLALKVMQEGEGKELFMAEELSLGKLKEALETPSLFEKSKCCFIFGVEKLTKNVHDYLSDFVLNPHPQIRLVLTASQMPPFLSKLLKNLITLDLSLEKPWEREKRLIYYVTRTLQKRGISISPVLAELIIKSCGAQVAHLDQELEKLTCYLKRGGEVRREDLDLLQENFQHSIFKIGELLLENKTKEALEVLHQGQFPTILLIYSLRNLFQKSLRLKELSFEEAQLAFPTLKGKLLEKNLNLAHFSSKEKLKNALLLLFEIEVKMKNQKISESFLQSYLLLKLGVSV
jgi:DNA polymerase-3 subunit delta